MAQLTEIAKLKELRSGPAFDPCRLWVISAAEPTGLQMAVRAPAAEDPEGWERPQAAVRHAAA